MDYDEVYEKSGRTGSWYVTVARKIESDKADAVRAFKTEHDLRGVRLEPDTKGYYPNSSLACHLIGFVGTDNYGLEGIEARYDSVLSPVRRGRPCARRTPTARSCCSISSRNTAPVRTAMI